LEKIVKAESGHLSEIPTYRPKAGFIPYLIGAVNRLDGCPRNSSMAFEHPNVVLVYASPNLFHNSKVAAIVD
jgi:hypothetical protein